jgi:hypothetical protein
MYRTQGYNGHWDKITLIHKNLPKKKKGQRTATNGYGDRIIQIKKQTRFILGMDNYLFLKYNAFIFPPAENMLGIDLLLGHTLHTPVRELT